MNHAVPDGSRQASASFIRRVRPAPSVVGFVMLLAVLFTASYMVGALAGPVAPSMRPSDGNSGASETNEPGGMGGMHGMRAQSSGEETR
jgi:hypothetical protein